MEKYKLTETQLTSEEVYHGSLLHVFKDEVLLTNNDTTFREYIKHVGAVCIVPIDEKGNVIMERQFRYPFHRVVYEIPAGKLNGADEDPLEAARRELQEETGYVADKWTCMGVYYPTVAYSDEAIYMYLAQDLRTGERKLDRDEFLNVEYRPLNSLIEDIMANKIHDGKTQLSLLKAALILKDRIKL